MTGSEAVERAGMVTQVNLPEGSWGEGGFHHIWLNDQTRWCWELIYPAETTMVASVARYKGDNRTEVVELLQTMGRELLLLEASDWPFVISTGTAQDYAEQRLREHYDAFMVLVSFLNIVGQGGRLDSEQLEELDRIRQRADIFPEVRPELWRD